MTVTADIATQLQTDGVGTIRSTGDWGIYENQMPRAPEKCISVFAYGGVAPPTAWDGEIPHVQVRVRGGKHDETDSTVHAATYAKAYAVMQSLHELTDATINSVHYYYIRALGSPASLGRDANGHDIYVLNFEVIKEFE